MRALPLRASVSDGALGRRSAQAEGRRASTAWRKRIRPRTCGASSARGGDPYAKVGLDPDGRAGIDWGVYGVPETFIVRGDGTIAYKVVGPLTAEILESEVKPQILKAMELPRS